MKAVFDSCMTSLPLLNEANLEVEMLRRDAFKPTTPRIYKSLISKPGVSKTLLFGDNMEDQMRSLETKEKLQKALEPEKPQKKTWAPSSTTTKRFQPYGKASPNCEHHFGETSLLKEVVPQKIKVRSLPLSTVSPHALADIHPHLSVWERITSDSVVLGIIREGITIDFLYLPHCSNSMPLCNVSFGQRDAINQLLALGVISEATYHTDRYVFSVFTTEKLDRSLRMILNLKHFNVFVNHVHFKMESLQDVICLIQPGVWMGSVDLKDAYYSVQVHHLYKKFVTFYCHGRFYEYNCMPNGYAQAPLLFTKILKQPFAALRRQGLLSVVYLDDSYLQRDSYSRCLENIHATTSLLTDLGFQINNEKSLLTPTQTIRFLGFILDSV